MKSKSAVLSACFLTLASLSEGAVVGWSAPVGITGDSDVSTTGELVRAYNFASDSAATVNGVQFQATSTTATGGGQSVAGQHTFAPTPGYSTAVLLPSYSGSEGDFGSLSPEYQALLGSFASGSSAVGSPAGASRNGTTLTLQDLVIGQSYLLQIWANDSRGTNAVTFGRLGLEITAPTAPANGIVLRYNGTGGAAAEGAVGQYAIGTFTADATTQSFSLYSGGGSGLATLNAYQLRAIPEPTAAFLGVLGLSGFVMRRRL
jgi:hypothetical protein